MFEAFDHTADVGIRATANSLAGLFAEAARGLFSLIVTDAETIRELQETRIEINGDELEYLLFDWLSELLYRYETEKLLFRRFDVAIDPQGLHAICYGEPVAAERHELDHEVKAITYHDLIVKRDGDDWLAEVIVDI